MDIGRRPGLSGPAEIRSAEERHTGHCFDNHRRHVKAVEHPRLYREMDGHYQGTPGSAQDLAARDERI